MCAHACKHGCLHYVHATKTTTNKSAFPTQLDRHTHTHAHTCTHTHAHTHMHTHICLLCQFRHIDACGSLSYNSHNWRCMFMTQSLATGTLHCIHRGTNKHKQTSTTERIECITLIYWQIDSTDRQTDWLTETDRLTDKDRLTDRDKQTDRFWSERQIVKLADYNQLIDRH